MASDEDYMSFLAKANQDSSGGGNQASTQSKTQFKTTDSKLQVPKEITDAVKDEFYVSDADEPFHPVALSWSGEGGLPDEVEFAKLISHWDAEKADIEIMDPADWDRKGQYSKLVDAVTQATKGNDVRVYAVKRDHSRIEYWVISGTDGGIVGAKALAVES